MNYDNKDSTSDVAAKEHGKGQSQDAIRHEKDALHHKFHKGSPHQASALPPLVETQSDAGEQIEAQPEVPKVGSRDAPGG